MTHFLYFVISVKVNVNAHLLTVMFLSISLKIAYQNHLRDGPLENLWWGGPGGRSTKKIFAHGKIK